MDAARSTPPYTDRIGDNKHGQTEWKCLRAAIFGSLLLAMPSRTPP